MLIPINGGQVNWQFDGAAAPTGAEVTLGFNHELYGGTPADAANEFRAAWQANITPRQSNQIRLVNTLVKYGPNDVGPTGEQGSAIAGAVSSPSEPPQVAVLVQKVTGIGGRTGRGRMFIPGSPENVFDTSGIMTPTQVTGWQTAVDGLLSGLTSVGLVPVLLHAPASPVAVPYPITELRVSAQAATQRQRMRR